MADNPRLPVAAAEEDGAYSALRGSRWASTRARLLGHEVRSAGRLSSRSMLSRRKAMFASSACSSACEVYSVEARSGAGEERYDSGVRGRVVVVVGVCGRDGLLCRRSQTGQQRSCYLRSVRLRQGKPYRRCGRGDGRGVYRRHRGCVIAAS